MAQEVITIDGLREFQAKLKRADGQSQKELRLVLNDAAELIVVGARPLVPRRSGKAAGSVKARSTQRMAQVKAGGARVPYYPWLDFGGAVGRQNSIRRPFIKEGRYLYPTFIAKREPIRERLAAGLANLIQKAGLG